MLKPILFDIRIFRDRTDSERERSQRVFLWLLEALVRCNLGWLEAHPDTPDLYKSKVVYKREEPYILSDIPHVEEFQDIPCTLEKGWGDCEDLACYMVAQRIYFNKLQCHPLILWRPQNDGSMMYHCVCEWPDGRLEDPSTSLGMKKDKDGNPIIRREPLFVGRYEPFTFADGGKVMKVVDESKGTKGIPKGTKPA